uniref:Uncharacterized protein n=1 Tax=mine drainage metagenome TaxID=410659 RepID=E6QL34_9ZZZZ
MNVSLLPVVLRTHDGRACPQSLLELRYRAIAQFLMLWSYKEVMMQNQGMPSMGNVEKRDTLRKQI